MNLNIQLPHGKFSYAMISGRRVNNIKELGVIPDENEPKHIWISREKRKTLSEEILVMVKSGKKSIEIINHYSGSDLIRDKDGHEMKPKGLSSLIERVKRANNHVCKRGRPFKEK